MAENDANQTQLTLLTSAPVQLEEKSPADLNAVSSVQPFGASVAQLPVYPTKVYPHSSDLACSVIVAVLYGICNLLSIT